MTESERVDWLRLRRTGIGGTDMAAIMGLSPWKTQLDVYLDKTTDQQPEESTPAMEWGLRLENAIAEAFQDRHPEYAVKSLPFISGENHCCGSLDRVLSDEEGCAVGVLEIKTARSSTGWGDEGTDQVPMQYIVQCMHYMGLTGANFAYIAVLIGGSDYREYYLERDQSLIDTLAKTAKEWWEKHITGNVPPEPRTASDVQVLYPSHTEGSYVNADEEMYQGIVELAKQKALIKSIEASCETIEEKIKSALCDAEEMRYNGQAVVTWRKSKDSTTVDVAALPADIKKQYSKTRPGSRRFIIKVKGEEE